MATDEEVDKQRAAVIELRAKLAEAKTNGADVQREAENEITLTQLKAEEVRLQNELAAAQEAQKPATVKRGVAAPLGTALQQMQASVAHQEAVAAEVAANKTGNKSGKGE